MKKISFIICLFLILGCNSKKKEQVNVNLKEVQYKQSEMAALMLMMYEVNLQNKQLILNGKQPKTFPKEFLKIHTAKLTDSTDRTTEFKMFSEVYLSKMKQVFEPSLQSLTEKHNTVVNSCIACHQTTCIGPIPKIKKLFIE